MTRSNLRVHVYLKDSQSLSQSSFIKLDILKTTHLLDLQVTHLHQFKHRIGWTDEDFEKPIVTIGAPWSNALPCNIHHRELADMFVDAIERRGGKAFVCGTPVISDGETQGSFGMKYSLISRDYIADCIEIMHEGYMADAMINLAGCDKTVPAAAMPIQARPWIDSVRISIIYFFMFSQRPSN